MTNLTGRETTVRYFAVFALVAMAGCVIKRPEVKSEKDSMGPKFIQLLPDDFPLFEDHFSHEELDRAIEQQLQWFDKQSDQRRWQFGELSYSAREMALGLRRFRQIFGVLRNRPEELREALILEFNLYRVEFDGRTGTLFTGYFSPIYEGSQQKSDHYRFPLYAEPEDLVSIRPGQFSPKFLEAGPDLKDDRLFARYDASKKEVVPYYTRKEIDGDKVLPQSDELVYLNNYMDQFLFHVQGGGFVKLEEGGYLRLNYAAKNGHPYRSLGKMLIEAGKVTRKTLTLPKVLEYFKQHPEETETYCFQNPSYVFYQRPGPVLEALTPEDFPSGSLGFPVTSKRSIATDKRFFPGGMLCYLKGFQSLPSLGGQALSGFVVDQDTGGAITGAHIDFFAGAGSEAGTLAGSLNDPDGILYLLLPKREFAP